MNIFKKKSVVEARPRTKFKHTTFKIENPRTSFLAQYEINIFGNKTF